MAQSGRILFFFRLCLLVSFSFEKNACALLAGNAKVSDGFDSGAAAGGWITNRYPATAQIQLIFTLFTLS